MSETARESQASLQVLVIMAKADGILQDEERNALEIAWKQLETPPEGVSIESLLSEECDLDRLLAQITTPQTRESLYEAALAMAKLGGTTPEEQQILDRIQTTFNLDLGEEERLFETAIDALSDETTDDLAATLDPKQREREVRDLILDYAIGISILGFNPIPGLNAVTTLAAYVLVLKMVRSIGAKWGYPKGQDVLAIIGNLFGGLGAFAAGLTTWLAVSLVGMFVPIVGSAANASFLFTVTWAMGQATNRYYASGRQMSAAELKQAFREAKKEGKSVYQENEATIASQQKSSRPQIEALGRQLKSGEISQQDYQEKLRELWRVRGNQGI